MDSKCVTCGEPCDKIPYKGKFLSFCKGGCGRGGFDAQGNGTFGPLGLSLDQAHSRLPRSESPAEFSTYKAAKAEANSVDIPQPQPQPLAWRNVTYGPKVPLPNYEIPVGNHFAMDKDGWWSQYEEQPSVSHSTWIGGFMPDTHEMDTPLWPDWEDSLFLMTETGLVKV